MKLVVVASNRGSNFEAIARAVQSGDLNAEIAGLVCHREGVPVLEKARQLGIPSRLVRSRDYRREGGLDRVAYETALADAIHHWNPDYICLAGYMMILGPTLLERWPNRILNIHPSLLPSFRGLHAQRQALEAGVEFTGCTVHFVTGELDGGPILAQAVVPVEPGDTEDTLSARLLPTEHATYVKALQRLSRHAYRIEGNRVRWEAPRR